MTTDTLIAPIIDRYLVAANEERVPDGMWHPSSLFQCDRQATYGVRGMTETDPKEPEDYRPLVMGKLLHTLVQSAVSHDGAITDGAILDVHHEVKVTIPTLNVTGSADSLVMLMGEYGAVYEVEEFKSTKSAGIKWAKGKFAPKPNHVSQALTYAFGMKYFPFVTETEVGGVKVRKRHDPLGGKLKDVRVTYIGKDNFEIHEFRYELTPEWEANFVTYMTGLEKYRVDDKALPPRLPREDNGGKNWLCKSYCGWRSRCWDVDGEGVEL